jgi:hypothetical protein
VSLASRPEMRLYFHGQNASTGAFLRRSYGEGRRGRRNPYGGAPGRRHCRLPVKLSVRRPPPSHPKGWSWSRDIREREGGTGGRAGGRRLVGARESGERRLVGAQEAGGGARDSESRGNPFGYFGSNLNNHIQYVDERFGPLGHFLGTVNLTYFFFLKLLT